MTYLLVTNTSTTDHDTPSSAVEAAGFPKWDCAAATRAVSALHPGDEVELVTGARVIKLSGVRS